MVFGSRVIKPTLNRARLVKETMRERANKSTCKGMLNEVVPKSTAVGQRECGGRARERKEEEKKKRRRCF